MLSSVIPNSERFVEGKEKLKLGNPQIERNCLISEKISLSLSGASVTQWSKARAYETQRLSPPEFKFHWGQILL